MIKEFDLVVICKKRVKIEFSEFGELFEKLNSSFENLLDENIGQYTSDLLTKEIL